MKQNFQEKQEKSLKANALKLQWHLQLLFQVFFPPRFQRAEPDAEHHQLFQLLSSVAVEMTTRTSMKINFKTIRFHRGTLNASIAAR